MKKWALIPGVAGALWMAFVLYSKPLPQARVSNADKEKLDYARNLDVHQLDPMLSPMRLED
jgi:hypothetical protein